MGGEEEGAGTHLVELEPKAFEPRVGVVAAYAAIHPKRPRVEVAVLLG